MTDKLPPLPTPDTHCFDDDTGFDCWSYSGDQVIAYALLARADLEKRVEELEASGKLALEVLLISDAADLHREWRSKAIEALRKAGVN